MGLINFIAKKGLAIQTGANTTSWLHGSGTPNGAVAANVGSIYSDYTSGVIYKKVSGTNNLGWEEMSGASAIDAFDWKSPVLAATTASDGNLNLASYTGTIDGQTLVNGGRYLLKNQSDASENGIYTWATGGVFTRSTDADSSVPDGEVKSGMAVIASGGTQAKIMWVLTTPGPITLDTTSLTFTSLGNYTASLGVKITGNNFSADLDAAGGIGLNTNSLKINTGDGIALSGNAVIAVADTSGPITVGAAGIDITTGNGISTGTTLSVVADASGPITVGASGVDITTGNGLSTGTTLSVVADSSGALSVGSSGVSVNVDVSSVYKNGSNQLAVKNYTTSSTTTTAGPDTIDSVAISTAVSAKWLLTLKNGTAGVYTSEVLATNLGTGTTCDFTEYAVVTVGTITTAPVVSVDVTSGNMNLKVTTDSGLTAEVVRITNA